MEVCSQESRVMINSASLMIKFLPRFHRSQIETGFPDTRIYTG